MRVRRAAKPQTGGIHHQNDCLVETSNFSSLSARGREHRLGSLLASGCWVSGLRGQPRQKGPEAGTRDASLPGRNHTRKTLGYN